jgi:hypothetical protein
MIQKWIVTYPVQWFELLLTKSIKPFSKARTMETYARNGYFLIDVPTKLGMKRQSISAKVNV